MNMLNTRNVKFISEDTKIIYSFIKFPALYKIIIARNIRAIYSCSMKGIISFIFGLQPEGSIHQEYNTLIVI